jgi:hypothetical protein
MKKTIVMASLCGLLASGCGIFGSKDEVKAPPAQPKIYVVETFKPNGATDRVDTLQCEITSCTDSYVLDYARSNNQIYFTDKGVAYQKNGKFAMHSGSFNITQIQ